MRFVLPVIFAAAAIGVPGSAARNVSSSPLLTYSVLYSADAKAGHPDGGVCATDPNGHSFRVTDPYPDFLSTWSQDGKRVAFTRSLERAPGGIGNITDILIADARGRPVRNLTARIGGNINGGSSWSPDGSQIAFVSGWYGAALSVAGSDGTASREIAEAPYPGWLGGPSWSPVGRRILFTRYLPQTAVYGIDADGSNEAKLVDSADGAVWSPDGTRIAYLAMDGRQSGIVVAAADGSDPHTLTGEGAYGGLAWSPDGEWIAFSQDSRVMLIRPDGTDEHAADTDGLPASDPSWLPAAGMPPNRRPCVVSGTRRADVLRGTPRGDLINGRGGRDTIYARGGDDVLIGGPGEDRLYGGAGRDLFGATDHYRDLLSGNQGVDSAYFNKRDRLKSIELNALTDGPP